MSKRHERSQSHDSALQHPSPKRAKEIDAHPPLQDLLAKVAAQKKGKDKDKDKTRNVLHWFRTKDLRAEDNRALHAAAQQAAKSGGHLVTCFLWSPTTLARHGTSAARTDFLLESLRCLQTQLHALHIPLVVLSVADKDDDEPEAEVLRRFVEAQRVGHVFANIEYEIDELRRDIRVLAALGSTPATLDLRHDQTVVEPGALKNSRSGGVMKVFTPYHKAWLARVAQEPALLALVAVPAANDGKKARAELGEDLFASPIPSSLPRDMAFGSADDKKRIRALWPAGHQAAVDRLQHFLAHKVRDYQKNRSVPAADNSSRLSPYLAAGVLSVREAVAAARDANNATGADFGDADGDEGIASWVREVVFREFYRQTLVTTPHDAMNLPHNLKFDYVQWANDDDDGEEGWRKWCAGTTGVPFVDAGMRQLRAEAYMHNRLRMNTSSYLRTNLLVDYRRGERFFAEHLVDWDLSNNTAGWEPSYTVFNPVVQAEKCDPRGEYIRRWVPELREVEGKAVFDPFHRLSDDEFKRLVYPAPHVDFQESKRRCIERYKQDMAEVHL